MGEVPWTREDMVAKLEEFALLYERRPIVENPYGMRSPHMFLAWFVLQALKPKAIVESGVGRGAGTWFFEQACPDAELYCIEPSPEFIRYRSDRGQYFESDFSTMAWEWLPRGDGTVLFFDDHQDALERVKVAKQLGFTHLLFEDNYPPGQGNCYSLKKAFEREDDTAYLERHLEVYQELPPVFKLEHTRWGDSWGSYSTPEPLLHSVEEQWQQVFWDEADTYTWMCYARIAS